MVILVGSAGFVGSAGVEAAGAEVPGVLAAGVEVLFLPCHVETDGLMIAEGAPGIC